MSSASQTTSSPSNGESDPSPWQPSDAAADSTQQEEDWLAGTLLPRSTSMTSASSSSSSSALSSILLWLPYLIFTVFLLGLIVVSFLRFHCQRGHQSRRRQAELNDKLQTTAGNHHDTLHLLPTSGEAGGGPLPPADGTTPPARGPPPT